MLAVVTWSARALVCLLAGVFTFAYSRAVGATLAFEVTAYAICLLVMLWWFLAELSKPVERSLSVTVALGLMTTIAAVVSAAPHGGFFIAFAAMGTLGAGADVDLWSGWIIAGTAILGTFVGDLVWHPGTGSVVTYPLVLIVAFISGRNRRAYLVQARQSQEMLAQLEELRAGQHRVAVLDERARIAREIHDVLAHSLGALGIHIQVVRAVLTDDRDIDRALGLLEQAQRMATDGLVDTRRAVQALREGTTRLDEQIAALVEIHRARHGAPVDFQIVGQHTALTPEATVALIRAAQEALVNSAKHAPHQPVELVLRYDEDAVRLDVTNPLGGDANGRLGAAPEAGFSTVGGGYGLTGMRERLLLIHGTLTAEPVDGTWTVAAQVPR